MIRTATTPEGNDTATTENDNYEYATWVRWADHIEDRGGEQRIISFHKTYNAAKNNPTRKMFSKRGAITTWGIVEVQS